MRTISLFLLLIVLLRPECLRAEDTGAIPSAEAKALPHAFQHIGGRIYCSAEPETPGTFATIAQRGIRVIVSVDGKAPNHRSASAEGIRYIHLPIGYDTVPTPVTASIAKLLKETEGPILFHCHHGKHRGPAAAALAGMLSGTFDRDQALGILESSGTSREYQGLWDSVRTFAPLADLKSALPLQPVSPVDPLAGAMVSVDEAFTTLRNGFHAGNRPSNELHEAAALLVQGFQESARHAALRNPSDASLIQKLEENHQLALRLRKALEAQESITEQLKQLQAHCKQCHRAHRD